MNRDWELPIPVEGKQYAEMDSNGLWRIWFGFTKQKKTTVLFSHGVKL